MYDFNADAFNRDDRELDEWREEWFAKAQSRSRRQAMLDDINDERDRQDVKWGADREMIDGTGRAGSIDDAQRYTDLTDARAKNGVLSWFDILLEEVYEAGAETDPVKLRKELVQVAASAGVWIEAIDARVSCG